MHRDRSAAIQSRYGGEAVLVERQQPFLFRQPGAAGLSLPVLVLGLFDRDDDDAAVEYLGRAVQYLGRRLDEHCDDARYAFDRLHALRQRAEASGARS